MNLINKMCILALLVAGAIFPASVQAVDSSPLLQISNTGKPAINLVSNLQVSFLARSRSLDYSIPSAYFLRDIAAARVSEGLVNRVIGVVQVGKPAASSLVDPIPVVEIQSRQEHGLEEIKLIDTGLVIAEYKSISASNTIILLIDLVNQVVHEIDLGCNSQYIERHSLNSAGLMYRCRVNNKNILTIISLRTFKILHRFEENKSYYAGERYLGRRLNGYAFFDQIGIAINGGTDKWVCSWQALEDPNLSCQRIKLTGKWMFGDINFNSRYILAHQRSNHKYETALLSLDCLRDWVLSCQLEPLLKLNKALNDVKSMLTVSWRTQNDQFLIWSCPLCGPYLAQSSLDQAAFKIIVDAKSLYSLKIPDLVVVAILYPVGNSTVAVLTRSGLPVTDRYIVFASASGEVESVKLVSKIWLPI